MASANACLNWSSAFPISTAKGRCKEDLFRNNCSFQLGYIGSLAAVPFGVGSPHDPSISKTNWIARLAWIAIMLALILGPFRKRSYRYAQQSNVQFIWPLALASKLLSVAFPSLFGILVGDLNPNSNLLEVLVWIVPGLLYHRFSPELVQDNCLAGLFINTVTYLPGLITAAVSIWSAPDFDALVPVEAWKSDSFWRAGGASFCVKFLATAAVVVAVFRQMLGSYCNLVLSAKRRRLNNLLERMREAKEGDANSNKQLQLDQELVILGLYGSWGIPRPCVDLDWIAIIPHAILVLAESGIFIFLGSAIIATTNFVKARTLCTSRKAINGTDFIDGIALPVPSYFTLQRAVACTPNSCVDFNISEPFCQIDSFIVALLVGSLSIIFSSASLLWLPWQFKIVRKNHTDDAYKVRTKVPERYMRTTFNNQVNDMLGTQFQAQRNWDYWRPVFLLLTVWQPWRLQADPVGQQQNVELPLPVGYN